MKRLIVMGLLLGGTSALAAPPRFRVSASPVSESYIVVLDGAAIRSAGLDVRGALARIGASEQIQVTKVFESAIIGAGVRMPESTAVRLSRHPLVEFVEENGYVTGAGTQNYPPWGLDRIDQRFLPLTSPGQYNYLVRGSGVHVYLLDSGLHPNSEFTGRIGAGYGAVSDGRGTDDCAGHGTIAASIVGGTTYGVAKGVTLHPVRINGSNCANPPTGDWLDLIEGVEWVKNNRVNPAVALLNVEGAGNTAADMAIQSAIDSGLLFVFPSGNSGVDACLITPARVGGGITVGATTSSDAAYFTGNQGTCVDIFAPGVLTLGSGLNGEPVWATGTSFSGPAVLGIAAMYLSANPGASYTATTNAIVGQATQNVITGVTPPTANRLAYSGFIQCASGLSLCSEACVNLQSDPYNCGACGNVCSFQCSAGSCVEPETCPTGQVDCCGDGTCAPPASCRHIVCQ